MINLYFLRQIVRPTFKVSRFAMVLILSFIYSSSLLTGQSFCGHEDHFNSLLEEPGFEQFINEQLDDIHSMADQLRNSNASMDAVIPVVIHVVTQGEPVGTGNNFVYDDIIHAIDRLNVDFTDSGIKFCPALRNELGEPLAEPGVVRVNASSISDYVSNGIVIGSQTEVEVKELGPQFSNFLIFFI